MGKTGSTRFNRYSTKLFSCVVLLAFNSIAASAADAWQPHRPVEIVVPSAPGGGLDLVGRTLQSVIQQDKLSSKPVTVINRPGGGGTVGMRTSTRTLETAITSACRHCRSSRTASPALAR